MKRNNRNNTSIIKSALNHKPHDGIRRLLTSTPGAILRLIKAKQPLSAISIFSVIFTITIISNLTISSNSASATSSTLSLSIDNSTVSMSVSPTNINGSFNKSSASTISASTNNATGYTLSIAAPSSSGSDYDKLINGSDNTAMLNSITSATTEEQFKALNATFYNGMWGYLPSKHCVDGTASTCTNNTDFLPAPTISGDVLDVTAAANTASSNTADLASAANTYTLSIGARVDSSVKSGAYTNAFLVTAVANPITYSIFYNDATITNMPADINTGISMDDTVYISNSTPTKQGYTFLGWCTVTPTHNNNGTDTCSGTTYAPNDPYILNQTSTGNSLNLYTMWADNYTIDALVAAGGTLQDFAYMSTEKKGKIALSIDPTRSYTLKDSRDNQDYTIAKLKDGNIWMTKNLNLNGGIALSAANTDVDYGYISSFTTSNNLTKNGDTLVLPASSTNGFDTDNYSYVYKSNSTVCGDNSPCYSYYSWDAATLGSGRGLSVENVDAPYSICPKGWRLPTSGDDKNTIPLTNWKRGDFYRLATAYGANLEDSYRDDSAATGANFYNNAGPGTVANFLLAGSYNGGRYYDDGGRYWVSTSSEPVTHSRDFNFTADMVHPCKGNYRRGGYSIRCLLK